MGDSAIGTGKISGVGRLDELLENPPPRLEVVYDAGKVEITATWSPPGRSACLGCLMFLVAPLFSGAVLSLGMLVGGWVAPWVGESVVVWAVIGSTVGSVPISWATVFYLLRPQPIRLRISPTRLHIGGEGWPMHDVRRATTQKEGRHVGGVQTFDHRLVLTVKDRTHRWQLDRDEDTVRWLSEVIEEVARLARARSGTPAEIPDALDALRDR